MAFGPPGKKLGGNESRQKQESNDFLHEASDLKNENIPPRHTAEKFPDDCSQPILWHA
jgi:hypothetical protein